MSKLIVSSIIAAAILLTACSDEKPAKTAAKSGSEALISAPAELVSLQEIGITPPSIRRMWEYKIEYIARENTLVKAGDLLVKFDGESLRNNLVSRRSELDAAIKESEQKKLENEATLEQYNLDLAEAKKDMDIATRKVAITDVSRSDIERRKQQAELRITTELHQQAIQRVAQHKIAMQINEQVQQARISKAQSKVDELNENIKKLEIKAPKEGMVVLVPNSDDEKPAIGDTVFMGSLLISLPALDKIAVKVEFDESFTPDIVLGNAVRITLDAFPERPFSGTISELGKSYRNKSSTNQKMVFDAWVTLDELDMNIMRPGMKATVDIIEELI
ncbi:HlyD family secretion protein [Glaciecola sp. SC05]|uniref:HlyD family secretion protein n=1 Tax=Glaciecola sp. SC05 TaxID=1987355 RepID=UPI003527F95A